MIIKTLKVRILRALKSLPAASGGAESPPPSPTKPGALGGVVSFHADALSDDASFFDAREAETPTKSLPHHPAEAEPLDAWELVDADGRSTAPAPEVEAAAAEEEGDDPDRLLQEFPARCPPGGDRGVVLYTTTLRGVRRTFEDCNRVRALLECLGADFQERDVSMDRGLRDELWALTGDRAVPPPRLFARGRDLGGAAQVLALHEDGRLASLLLPLPDATKHAGRGGGKCEACGGLRFVVCGECDGSRKVFDGGRAARCLGCNENGLVMCPLCSS